MLYWVFNQRGPYFIMLRVEGLTKSYQGEDLFDDLSFNLVSKQKFGLIGKNGVGKTTFFKLILGMEEADSGQIHVPKGYKFGYLQQHIAFSQDTLLQEACLGLPSEERDQTYKAEKILFGLGFSKEDMMRAPSALSGGFFLRLHLAKALLCDPDCLLLDEPTNYLDILSIRFLERFLRSFPKEFIIISHEQEFIDMVSTDVCTIYRKKFYSVKGKSCDLFDKILEEETIYERAREKTEKKKEKVEKFISRFGAKATKAKQAKSKLKSIEKLPALEKLALMQDLYFTFPYEHFPGRKMLEIKDLTFSYDKNPLIEDFSLLIENKEKIGLIGKNARGKSTLLNLLTNNLSPQKGTISKMPNLKVGFFGQTNIERLNQESSIEEEISLSNPDLDFTQIRSVCGLMLFPKDAAKKKIKVLSGGEKSRVLLGKILASKCNLLLLDEPTHHLDVESIEALIYALGVFEGSLILVTHSEYILKKVPLSKLIICTKDKQRVFHGDYNTFLDKVGWEEQGAKSLKKKDSSHKEKRALMKEYDKQINKIEKKIMDDEKKMHSIKDELVLVSENQDIQKIQDLSKSLSEKEKILDDLYHELHNLYSSKESIIGSQES